MRVALNFLNRTAIRFLVKLKHKYAVLLAEVALVLGGPEVVSRAVLKSKSCRNNITRARYREATCSSRVAAHWCGEDILDERWRILIVVQRH